MELPEKEATRLLSERLNVPMSSFRFEALDQTRGNFDFQISKL
jgi:hypothetical protein